MVRSTKRSRGFAAEGSNDRSHVFDTINQLESQDTAAARKRRLTQQKQREQSLAAKSQTQVHQCLVEGRILFQRSVTSLLRSVEEETFDTGSAAVILQECDRLLANLLEARRILCLWPESALSYHSLLQADADEGSDKLNQVLQEEYEKCREDWKQVLNKRHQQVQLQAGGSKKKHTQFLRVMDATFWQQVESTIQHEQLRQRQSHQPNEAVVGGHEKKLELFDDTKVYQHLLKDFVTQSQSMTANNSSGNTLARRKLQESSSSRRKDVDRRASKGRKLRYNEIAKIVNFTFPTNRPNGTTTTSLDTDEWFRSLFGGAVQNSDDAV